MSIISNSYPFFLLSASKIYSLSKCAVYNTTNYSPHADHSIFSFIHPARLQLPTLSSTSPNPLPCLWKPPLYSLLLCIQVKNIKILYIREILSCIFVIFIFFAWLNYLVICLFGKFFKELGFTLLIISTIFLFSIFWLKIFMYIFCFLYFLFVDFIALRLAISIGNKIYSHALVFIDLSIEGSDF